MSLDTDVRKISAFKSFDELVEDMRRTGYVPTIRVESDFANDFNASALTVRKALHQRKLRVHPAFGVYDEKGHARKRRLKHRLSRRMKKLYDSPKWKAAEKWDAEMAEAHSKK